jgi:hypothetical protein
MRHKGRQTRCSHADKVFPKPRRGCEAISIPRLRERLRRTEGTVEDQGLKGKKSRRWCADVVGVRFGSMMQFWSDDDFGCLGHVSTNLLEALPCHTQLA